MNSDIINLAQLGYVSKAYYKEHGKDALQKIIKRIESENISIVQSFKYSIDNQASYIRDHSGGHTIIYPQFTDSSDMMVAISLAHELGHYYLASHTMSLIKQAVISSKNAWCVYKEEQWAWNEAEKILIEEEVFTKYDLEAVKRMSFRESTLPDDAPTGFLAAFDYINKKTNGLRSYSEGSSTNLILNLFRTIALNVVQPLFIIYILIGLGVVFINNQIPPFTILHNVEIHGILKLNGSHILSTLFFVYPIFLLAKLLLWIGKNK